MKNVVLIGAGITSLSIAKRLIDTGFNVTILEKTSKVGGMCASFRYGDCILDYGPHKFYTQIPGINREFKEIVGEGNYMIVTKKNSIRLQGKYLEFPVKLTQLATRIKPAIALKVGIDFGKNFVNSKIGKGRKKEIISFEDYFMRGFGKTGFDILFGQYARKVWGDPSNLTADLGKRRVPVGSVFDVLKNIFLKKRADVSAETFYYPKYGYGVICENLAKQITEKGGKIIFNSTLDSIMINNSDKSKEKDKQIVKEVKFKDEQGKEHRQKCDTLVSSLSIKDLPKFISPKPGEKIIKSAESLKFRSLVIAFLTINKNRCLKDNWIFFPEKEFCFNRVSEQKSFSEYMIPEGKTVIMAEITCDYNDDIYNASEEKLKEMIVGDLEKAGLVKGEEVVDFFTKKTGGVYPVYTLDYKDNLNSVLEYLDTFSNLFTVGRLGLYNYNNADHCLDMGKVVANLIIENNDNKKRTKWKKAREYFDNYKIVD